METKLLVFFQGSTAGLDEHRLSLGLFGDALKQMLAAMRRLASNMITQAQVDEDGAVVGGRLAREAQAIDLEIASLEKGSVGLGLAVVARLAIQGELFDTLPDRVCAEFVEAVKLESQGKLRSGAVRSYLHALPPGLIGHTYLLKRSDGTELDAKVEVMSLATLPPPPPRMLEMSGPVVGVGFEPGKWEVRLLEPATKRSIVCSATEQQVAAAIGLRSKIARVFLVTSGAKTRLVRIQAAEDAPIRLSEEERDALVFNRWDDLLRRLAQ